MGTDPVLGPDQCLWLDLAVIHRVRHGHVKQPLQLLVARLIHLPTQSEHPCYGLQGLIMCISDVRRGVGAELCFPLPSLKRL